MEKQITTQPQLADTRSYLVSKYNYDQFVSLGKDCHSATMIRCKYFNDLTSSSDYFFDTELFMSQKYPFGAYLFDWLMLASPDNIMKCLDLNFDGFLKRENFYIIKKRRGCCVANSFGIEFRHFDKYLAKIPFSAKDEKDTLYFLDSIFPSKIEKYKYLVDKFQKLLNSNKKVLFVYDDYIANTQIEKFVTMLSKLNEFNCDAHLLVMSSGRLKEINVPNLHFGKVVRRGAFTPEHPDEYTSWLKSFKKFSLNK